MNLKMDEKIICEEGGSYFQDFAAVGGRLTLTNKRILFRSNKNHPKTCSLEVDLSNIDKVDFFKTLNVIPNGLTLLLSDGSIVNFVVDNRQEWKTRIVGVCEKSLSVNA